MNNPRASKKKTPAHVLVKFVRGFKYASQGILLAAGERNMRFHIFAAVVALCAGAYFPITKTEWMIVLMLIGMVMSAEIVNTALEALANNLRDDLGLPYDATKSARDLAAGAVLVLAIVAAVVGVLIFGPYVLDIFITH